MNHSKLLLLLTLMIGGGNVAHSQTDVTSQYLVNANFEGSYTAYAHPNGGTTAIYQPDGWDIAYSNGNSSDVTALNKKDPGYSSSFGKVEKLTTGGKNTYLVYFYSGTKQTLTLSQEAVLPAGHYTVTADVFFTGQYSTSSFSVDEQVWNIELVAGTADGGIWKKASLSFTLDEETTVPFTYTISHPKKKQDGWRHRQHHHHLYLPPGLCQERAEGGHRQRHRRQHAAWQHQGDSRHRDGTGCL